MRKANLFFLFIPIVIAFISCSSNNQTQKRGEIVFGDSSFIVTETDTRLLTNNIEDFKPVENNQQLDTANINRQNKSNQDSSKTINTLANANNKNSDVETKTTSIKSKSGLELPFSDASLFIPNIEAKSSKKINWERDNSASYTLTDGQLNGKSIVIDMYKTNKVQLRTQTIVAIKTPSGQTLPLEDLGRSLSDWHTLNGKNNEYSFKNLDNNNLEFDARFSNQKLQSAIKHTSRKRKINSKEMQKILTSARKVDKANEAPCLIMLSSVMLRIDGVSKNGKQIHKDLRIDIPF